MKKIGFIGAYDKLDMIMYIAKILTLCKKRVLVVDSTINQKSRYIIPAINPTATYITEFEAIDFAVGFTSMAQIQQYLKVENKLPYDIALIDIDNPYNVAKFGLEEAEKNYFVAGYDLFSIRRGIQTIALVQNPIKLTKILYSQMMTKEESDYIEHLASGRKVVWDKNTFYFPLGNDDWVVVAENERAERINLKRLSSEYKYALAALTNDLTDDIHEGEINRAIKRL